MFKWSLSVLMVVCLMSVACKPVPMSNGGSDSSTVLMPQDHLSDLTVIYTQIRPLAIFVISCCLIVDAVLVIKAMLIDRDNSPVKGLLAFFVAMGIADLIFFYFK